MENIENRKKRPGYNPYDEVDEDTGMVCVPYSVLFLYYSIVLHYYIILYYIVLYYSILYYIILYYIMKYCIILYYIILYYIILYYIILYYIILYYIILKLQLLSTTGVSFFSSKLKEFWINMTKK